MRRVLLATLAAWALTACQSPASTFFVRSEGADMPVIVEGNTASNKLVLFIHGGPGGSSVARISSRAFARLEASFGLAYWDQRGAGTAQGNAVPGSLVLDRYVQDLDAVVDVLRQRHPAAKLYLMSHSWGGPLAASYLASPARQAKVAGWVGVDGAYSIAETNRLSREWAIAQARSWQAQGKQADMAAQALAWYDAHPTITADSLDAHIGYVRKLNGYAYDPDHIEQPDRGRLIFLHPYAYMSDAFNTLYTMSQMDRAMLLNVNTLPDLARVTLPTLLVSGRQDGAVPVGMAEEALAQLGTAAPAKALHIFERSAHDPMREEADAFAEAVEGFVGAP